MSKINISTASKRTMSKFDKSSTHITTLDVGHIRPVGFWEGISGDKIHVNYGQFSRLSPLVAPTFGSFRMKTFFFNVPYSSVWHNYDFFRSNNTDASIDKRPVNFSLATFLLSLYSNQYSDSTFFDTDSPTSETVLQVGQGADFAIFNPTETAGTFSCYNCTLTAKGRWLWNTMMSCGYEIPHILFGGFNSYTPVSSDKWYYTIYQQATKQRYSIYPLLAFMRCLVDFIYPSSYVNQLGLMRYFTENPWDFDDVTDVQPTIVTMLKTKLYQLLLVPYDQSFFTALWQQPNQVVTGSGQSTISSTNIFTTGAQDYELKGVSGGTSTAVTQNSSNQSYVLSSHALRWLTAASDYIMRNNIGGSRVHEWLRAHFGFATDEQDKWRSMFLKSFTSSIQISDVTSTANVANSQDDSISVLGEMAGKGIANDGGSLDFTFKEDGFVIAIACVVPIIGYYQGNKPFTEGLTDYRQLYLPEYDSIGFEGVPKNAVYNEFYSASVGGGIDILGMDEVFGFAPRFANRYKRGYDYLTGDFRFPSRGAENLKSYHTFRDVVEGRTNLALDLDFLRVDNQYNRIFNMIDGYDHILTIFQFDVTQYSHMLSIGESMPIFDKQGRDVTLDNQGTQLS